MPMIDRTGKTFGKVVALRPNGNRWVCRCSCGRELEVLSTNLANYAKNGRGCIRCGTVQDVTGRREGMLVAVSSVQRDKGHPLWTFQCDCGGSITGTVREFKFGWLRSCGCHDSAWNSWNAMMSRCYDESNNRYTSYGGRGIKVCDRWHDFKNFVKDMGERPRRHNLGRKRAEHGYEPENCIWEHVSENCRDTKNDGMPTRPGLKKGAKPRKKPASPAQ